MTTYRKCLAVGFVVACSTSTVNGYSMAPLKYRELFQRADCVVIATPLKTKEAEKPLEVDRPQQIRTLLVTVDTEFEVAYVLKGDLKAKTFHLLHLNRKDRKQVGEFGAVGTFFLDFEAKESKKRSFILFLKRHGRDSFTLAWPLMQGSRAIIPVRKDGSL